MTMNQNIIDLTSKVRKLMIPQKVQSWLLVTYGWEVCDDLWSPEELMDIIEESTHDYLDGRLDVSLPDEAALWKERAETAKFILQGFILENNHLNKETMRLITKLQEKDDQLKDGLPF